MNNWKMSLNWCNLGCFLRLSCCSSSRCSHSFQESNSGSLLAWIVPSLHAVSIPATSPSAPAARAEGCAGPTAQKPDHCDAEGRRRGSRHRLAERTDAKQHDQEHGPPAAGAQATQKERTQTWKQGNTRFKMHHSLLQSKYRN